MGGYVVTKERFASFRSLGEEGYLRESCLGLAEKEGVLRGGSEEIQVALKRWVGLQADGFLGGTQTKRR